MRVISRKTLKDFTAGNTRQDANACAEQIDSWYHEVKGCAWADPQEVKAKYQSASVLKNRRVVFNVCGNKYRLVVKINYRRGIVYIRFVGTHAEYDAIDAEEV